MINSMLSTENKTNAQKIARNTLFIEERVVLLVQKVVSSLLDQKKWVFDLSCRLVFEILPKSLLFRF